MKDWLKDRLKEKSTYRGLTLILAAFGVAIDPATAEAIAVGAVAIAGVIEGAPDER